jgi:hypothetical protein
MSKSLSTAAIAAFDGMVKHAYQDAGSNLRETVTLRTGVTGTTKRFNNLGKGLAQQRTTQTDVTPMNLVHSNQTATLVGWVAAEYTDIFDEDGTNIDERQELASAIGKAINRREDQMIIDALEAASSSLTVAASVGGAATDLNPAKLRRGNRLLGDQGVEVGGAPLCYVGSHQAKENMLAQQEVTSADYNNVRRLVSGEVDNWLGIRYKWVASRTEGGLTKSGNDRTSFLYDRAAVGHAVGNIERTEINYIPQKTSWLAAGFLRAGSKHIDANGIVEMTTTEPA